MDLISSGALAAGEDWQWTHHIYGYLRVSWRNVVVHSENVVVESIRNSNIVLRCGMGGVFFKQKNLQSYC
jgi:hypothetical protein